MNDKAEMTNAKAVELFKEDGTPAGVFYCSECRCVYLTKDAVSSCHGEHICACGEKIKSKYRSECDACQRKKSNEQETAKENLRFEKSQKVAESEYDGEMVSDGDKFYSSVEEAIDEYIAGQEPEYLWACKNIGIPTATTEDIYENLIENMWEEADVSDLNGVDELEAAVTVFNKANKSINVYQPDYTKAVLVQKRTAETTHE